MKKKNRLAFLAGIVLSASMSAAACFTISGCGNSEEPTSSAVPNLSYYTVIDGKEYDFDFNDTDLKFSFSAADCKSGQYYYDGESSVSLTFDDGNQLKATIDENGNLVMIYNGVTYDMLPKVSYTVTYNTNGGSSVSSTSVINGKAATSPATNPTKDGYVFAGWYTDNTYTTEFDFENSSIKSDTQVYALFLKADENAEVFNIDFDLGYENAPSLNSIQTINGKVYNLPEPTRTGYTFVGWWISDYQDGKKLTAQCVNGQTITANSTLYAVWDDGNPAVSVNSTGVNWTSTGVNRNYRITITNSDGTKLVNRSGSFTSYTYDFSSQPAGDYEITVSEGNSTTTVYYKNKALARVSLFNVDGNQLSFHGVANAENYILSYVCGTEGHDHTSVSLGNAFTYDFSACDMRAGGFDFVVTASAEGYAQSVSSAYNFERHLDAVTGIAVDGSTDKLSWNAVTNATSYIVEITQGDKTTKTTVDNATTLDLQNYYGNLSIKVTPVAHGYNSAQATEGSYNKVRLATPSNIHSDGSNLVWDAVEGAASYTVTINGKTVNTTSPSIAINEENFDDALIFTIVIKANSSVEANNSFASAEFNLSRVKINDNITYSAGQITWDAVFGATAYGVKVNDGEVVKVQTNTSAVTLTKAGENTISVCFYSGDAESDWVSIKVVAYGFTFNYSNKTETQYHAEGDVISLPNAEREGYTLLGWYSAAENGTKLDENVTMSSSDQTIYAYWKSNQYKATLVVADGVFNEDDIQGGTQTTTERTVNYGENYELPIPVCSDTTKAFGGWYTAENGHGLNYADFSGASTGVWSDANNVTLYALWVDAFEYTLNNDGTYSVKHGNGISYLKEVKVPAYHNNILVSTIDADCFKQCSTLEIINIPDTVTNIAVGSEGNSAGTAFAQCTKLKEVNIYYVEGNHERIYKSQDGILIYYNSYTQTTQLCYVPTAQKENVTIPEGVEEIPANAFKSHTTLVSIIIPYTVTYIGDSAFHSCTRLTSVTFESTPSDKTEKTLEFGTYVFRNCTQLKEITFPVRLKVEDKIISDYLIVTDEPVNFFANIFYGASNGSPSIEKINFEERAGATYQSIDGVVYANNNTELYYFPKNRSGDFVVPNTVKTIHSQAFYYNKLLQSVTIPGSVTKIGSRAFEGCASLGTLTFGGTKTDADLEIETKAFYGCTNLTSVTLPGNLAVLRAYAFGGTSKLLSVTVDCGKTEVNYETAAFGTDATSPTYYVASLYIGADCPDTIQIVGVFGSQANVNYDPENTNFHVDESGLVLNMNRTTIIQVNSVSGDLVIPDTITSIADGLFKDKTAITSVTIGANVENIGAEAFSGCTGLTTVTFVTGRTKAITIGEKAFYNCKNISSFTFPDKLEAIPASMLEMNTSGKTVLTNTALTELTIPEGVKTIGSKAFYNLRGLTTINLPSTLEDFSYGTGNTGKYYVTNTNTTYTTTYGTWITSQYLATTKNTAIDCFVNCTNLKTINIQSNKFALKDGVLYEKDKSGNLVTLLYSPRMNAGTEGVVTVPNTVTKVLDKAFNENEGGITKVVFEDLDDGSAIDIGVLALYECKSLTEVVLPKGLTSIPQAMFAVSDSLTKVNVPNTVTEIGAMAFAYCASLNEVDFEKDGTSGLKFLCSTFSNGNSMGVFAGCSSLTSLEFPERTTEIGSFTFYSGNLANYGNMPMASGFKTAKLVCGLKELTIPKNVTTISNYAFKHLSNLTKITFTDNTDSNVALTLGAGALQDCTSLKEVTLSQNITSIATLLFSGCSALTTINFPENGLNVTALPSSIFSGCKALKSIDLTKFGTLETIDASAFLNATGITSIEIPATVKTIGTKVFSGCTALNSITFKTASVDGKDVSSLTSIGATCFNKVALTSITFPETKDKLTLGKELFDSCTALTTVNIPSTVDSIDTVFDKCSSITKINIDDNNASLKSADDGKVVMSKGANAAILKVLGAVSSSYVLDDGLTEIGVSAFAGQNNITTLKIPKSVKSIGDNAFKNCLNLQKVIFEDGSQLVSLGANAFANCYNLKSINLEVCTKLTTLNTQTFYNDYALESIEIPSSVKNVGTSVFANCTSLRSAIVPAIELDTENGYTGDKLFQNCTSLTTVLLSDNITQLPQYMFYSCSSLATIKTYTTSTTETTGEDSKATLPSNLTEIGIYAFSGAAFTEVEIPVGVQTLGSANTQTRIFQYCANLQKVILNDVITSIGIEAFNSCPKLTTIGYRYSKGDKQGDLNLVVGEAILPDSLIEIGSNAFSLYYQTNTGTKSGANAYMSGQNFTKLTIPKNVKKIGDRAFGGLTSLNTVEIDATDFDLNIKFLFENCTGLQTIKIPDDIQELGEGIFQNCRSLVNIIYDGSNSTGINLPSTLLTFNNSVFNGCSSIEHIVIPDSVTSVGSYAFANCTSLLDATIGKGLISLGTNTTSSGYMFYGCKNLTTVKMYDSILSINSYSFAGCTSLKSIQVYNKSTQEYSAENVINLSKITTLGTYAFDGCTAITSVQFNDNLTAIGDYAFRNCSSIESLTMPKNLESLGNYTLYGCTSLSSISLPNSMTALGNYTFRGCTSLTSITLPTSLVSLGNYTFSFCTGLTSITLPANVTTIGDFTFNNCTKLAEININDKLTTIGKGAFNATALSTESALVITEDANIYIDATNGYLYTINKNTQNRKEVIKFLDTVTGDITLASGYYLGAYALSNNTNIEKITVSNIPFVLPYAFSNYSGEVVISAAKGSTALVEYAFYNYLGTNVTLPTTVTSIKTYAFANTSNLTSITLPTSLKTIGDHAFSQSGITSISLPSGVTTIEDYAFAQTKLTSVEIPASVTSLGSYLFNNCVNLETAVYATDIGTKTITIGEFTGCTSLKTFVIGTVTDDNRNKINLDGITTIGASAFYKSGITAVVRNSTDAITYNSNQYIFANCTSLTSVVWNSDTIGLYMFSGCTSLTSIDLSKVTTIGQQAFENTGLTSVDLSNVTSVDSYAFFNCTALTSATIKTGTTVGTSIFLYGSSDLVVTYKVDALDSREPFSMTGCNGTLQIVVNE